MTLACRNLPAVREAQQGAAETVPHLDAQAVRRLVESARSASQTGERNALLIVTLYDGALRVCEALALRPIDLVRADTGCASAYWGASRAWWASAPPWWPISTSTPAVG